MVKRTIFFVHHKHCILLRDGLLCGYFVCRGLELEDSIFNAKGGLVSESMQDPTFSEFFVFQQFFNLNFKFLEGKKLKN